MHLSQTIISALIIGPTFTFHESRLSKWSSAPCCLLCFSYKSSKHKAASRRKFDKSISSFSRLNSSKERRKTSRIEQLCALSMNLLSYTNFFKYLINRQSSRDAILYFVWYPLRHSVHIAVPFGHIFEHARWPGVVIYHYNASELHVCHAYIEPIPGRKLKVIHLLKFLLYSLIYQI